MNRKLLIPILVIAFILPALALGGCLHPNKGSHVRAGGFSTRKTSATGRSSNATRRGPRRADAGKDSRQVIPAILYHHVAPDMHDPLVVTPETFESHLKFLSENGYKTANLDDFYSYLTKGTPLPSKTVLIQFDDGRKDQFVYAVPILKKYNFTATFFVNPKCVMYNSSGYMNIQDIQDLNKQGFDIESHTWSHPSLVKHQGETFEHYEDRTAVELRQSKSWLEQNLGKKVNYFAYPFGVYDDFTVRAVMDAGYKLAFTINKGVNFKSGQSDLLLKRFMILKKDRFEDFVDEVQSRPFNTLQLIPQDASVTRDGQPLISAVIEDTGSVETKDLTYMIDTKRKGEPPKKAGVPIVIAKEQKGASISIKQVLGPGLYTITLTGRNRQGKLLIDSWSFSIES